MHRLDQFLVNMTLWTLCIVCQQQTPEALKCPLKAEGAGDKSEAFLANMKGFKDLNQLPVTLKLEQHIDVDQLVKNQAKWHKSCHMKFSMSKLQRARKRGGDETIGNSSKRRHVCQALDKSNCIFCGNHNGLLHEFRTLDADENVRRMATDLRDTSLLTRIEGGDLTALKQNITWLA